MILFCGVPSEPPIRMAIQAAQELDVPHIIFNQRESLYSHMRLHISNPRGDDGKEPNAAGGIDGWLELRGERIRLSEIRGVYTRLSEAESLPEMRSKHTSESDRKHIRSLHDSLNHWLEMTPALVLNRASAMGSNASKPYQAQCITRTCLKTPPTLVTNDPALVKDFAARHHATVYKSISSVRSIVRELNPAVKDLSTVRALPTQFQARIPGDDVRVHVVGSRIFPTRICTKAVDYRYATRDHESRDMTPTQLPQQIEEACFALSKMLELSMCGIDLKVTPQGHWYCFEVNPSPAYSFFEENTGQRISTAIVQTLQETASHAVQHAY
jgi:glutathione synthase/RimK-type ligase-like ATP-grasp enzyme